MILLLGCVIGFLLGAAWLMGRGDKGSDAKFMTGKPTFQLLYFLYCNTYLGRWFTWRGLKKVGTKLSLEGFDSHSSLASYRYGGTKILAIPNNSDNYTYLMTTKDNADVILIDVGDPAPVLAILQRLSLTPQAILTTHKHWDHCIGNGALIKRFPELQIYGSRIDSPDSVNRFVEDKEVLNFGSLRFLCLLTPGHTSGHISYLMYGETLHPSTPDSLFTGDTLFIGGAGKPFEGRPSEMLDSLDAISALPRGTLIWPGHEYTAENLKFALSIEPSNEKIHEKLEWATNQRVQRLTTVPSILWEEKEYNPFLRTQFDTILDKTLGNDWKDEIQDTEPSQEQRRLALATLRTMKDNISSGI